MSNNSPLDNNNHVDNNNNPLDKIDTGDYVYATLKTIGFAFNDDFTVNAKLNITNGNNINIIYNNLKPNIYEYAIGAYIKIDANASEDTEISLKLGGGRHTGNVTDPEAKKGRCYDIGIKLDGSKIEVSKEFPHPHMHKTGIQKSLNLGNLENKWIGLTGIKLNTKENGNDGVRLIVFMDTSTIDIDNPQYNWQKILDVVDNGNWDIHFTKNLPISLDEVKEPWLQPYDPNDNVAIIKINHHDPTKISLKRTLYRQIRQL